MDRKEVRFTDPRLSFSDHSTRIEVSVPTETKAERQQMEKELVEFFEAKGYEVNWIPWL